MRATKQAAAAQIGADEAAVGSPGAAEVAQPAGRHRNAEPARRFGGLRDDILSLLPSLRAYGRSLTKNAVEADDLVQETLLKAFANSHRFTPGTNLRAWLFTIQRNTFYTDYQKRRRENAAQLDGGNTPKAEASQEWTLKMKAVKQALDRLPAEQREALMLVGGAGLSYEEAGEVCGCALGTIKSRVNRGRTRLLYLLQVETHGDYLRG